MKKSIISIVLAVLMICACMLSACGSSDSADGSIAGKYVQMNTEEIEGEMITAEYYVLLNEDHTGEISIQDTIDIMWNDTELYRDTDYGRESYEYVVEEGKMLVNFDGYWSSFEKEN